MTASADRTAWSDRTLPPPSAQAWATRSNAASCTSREAACAGAKSRPTSPTKRASLASCSNCATSSSVQRPSATHQGCRPRAVRTFAQGANNAAARTYPAGVTVTDRAPMPRCARPAASSRAFSAKSRWQCRSNRRKDGSRSDTFPSARPSASECASFFRRVSDCRGASGRWCASPSWDRGRPPSAWVCLSSSGLVMRTRRLCRPACTARRRRSSDP